MNAPTGAPSACASWDQAVRALHAGDDAQARRWLERTHRLVPADTAVALALAGLLLRLGEPLAALECLAPLDTDDAHFLHAAAHHAAGDDPAAAAAISLTLQSRAPSPDLAALATRISPSWIGLDLAGRVHTGPAGADLHLDGVPVELEVGRTLPPGWHAARQLEAGGALGSPLPVQRLLALAGVAEADDERITGWAYHPADPNTDPTILIDGIPHTATDPADGIPGLPPLARPRRFTVPRTNPGAVAVTDRHGRPLLGSPLPAHPPAPARKARPPPRQPTPRPVAVIVPVHGGGAIVRACLAALLAHTDATPILVVEDGSSDLPLAAWEATGQVRVIRHPVALGYPAAVNAGLAATPGHDVVLLNSDTAVPPAWLPRLRAAAYAAPDIATATPLSNQASILSFPDPAGAPAPDPATALALDRAAQATNPGQTIDIPVGVGFCLYVRRDALDRLGPFRADLFAQGYGEEVEFCLRARAAGRRHVAALDLFVPHQGGHSFSLGAADLRRRNDAIVARLHPGFPALVAAHHAADPLHPARRRLETAHRAATTPAATILLVTHDRGGGTEEFVAARAAQLRAEGHHPAILRPAAPDTAILDASPNLRYRLPAELPDLAALLGAVTRVELHHALGHHRSVLDLASRLGAPLDTWVHDAAPICPRLSLIGPARRYCGEPGPADCLRCVATAGHHWHEDRPPAALRADWAALFASSRRVVVPTADAALRLRRQFPAVAPHIHPLEDDACLPPLAPLPPPGPPIRIAVPGAIGVEKGFDVLLACTADAAARRLPLAFTVVGHTEDDETLMAAGPAFVTGPYQPAEAVRLIRAERAHLAFIPSIWPETWCFALSRAWQAGLFAVAFDLGAQAERIRTTGRGALLPLALPAAAVNDALLRLARLRQAAHAPTPLREASA